VMAPPKFGDLGKKAGDLLDDDYKFDGKAELKSKLPNGIALTSTFTRAENGSITGVLQAKRKIMALDCTFKIDSKGKSNFVCEHGSLVPGWKFKAEGAHDGSVSKFSADAKYDMIMSTAALDANKSSIALTSAVGMNGFAAGVSTNYDFKKGALKTPDVAAEYTANDFQLGVTAKNGFSTIGAGYHKEMNKETSVAISVEQSSKDGKTSVDGVLGVAYKIDKDSSVKGKVNSDGIISFAYVQKLRPQLTIKLAGALNSSKLSAANAHKFGLTALMDY